MAIDNAKNFAKVTVSTGYDASATSIVLTTGHGTKLPTAPFNVVWWNSTDYPDPSDDPNVEIVRVTGVSTDTLTVTRAQESTTGSTKNTSAKVYKMIAGLTAKVINTDIASAIPSSIPQMVMSTVFEVLTRFDLAVVGSGINELTAGLGFNQTTGATISSSAKLQFTNVIQSGYRGSPTFAIRIWASGLNEGSGAASAFYGIGVPTVNGAGHTYTMNHIGFKVIKTGGVVSLYATQADGTTESASAALTTLTTGDIDLILKVNGTTSVDYYWSKSGGTLSAATNLTSNIPTGDTDQTQCSISNNATAVTFNMRILGMSYSR